MKRESVDSSLVKEAGYDAFQGVLEVKFADGDVYRYYLVPLRVFEELRASESPGRYFVANIKDVFRAEQVMEP